MEQEFYMADKTEECTVERFVYPRPNKTQEEPEVIQQASLGALMLGNPLFRKLFLGINRLGLLLVLKLLGSLPGMK
jgi:hypothetical protein